ncbi:TIGR04282 family arsenosugar biosynthesis glycosyltransferase [Pseudodesulfovibrio sp. zrk46]|uniref:TIGR04282 family arsenosugar biosynthesis glycosyltransferase n=1 Tax=Pseudodesulfovibrio sp. zrk46 TaxID=2725288 RepID=UPI001449F5E7|nr:TIGR04282 family arsenosugar biosynthesis glycosyltransferase [Pseudodesulfovibrio sp. zrk46]QJB55133.1 glycosyltransferase [Pseudodesulfovibrio sp. zrk46]
MKDCILFFVKYPEPGAVKTRLAEDSSPELAAEFYSVFAKEKLDELSHGSNADIIICFTPEDRKAETREWLGSGFRYIAQKGGDLGRRMENAFREAFFMGYDRALLVGSDIPALTSDIVNHGLEQIESGAAVLGPAEDGGYYLIGFPRGGMVPEVFHDIEWSTDTVAQETRNKLEAADLECRELEHLDDTDTLDDLEPLVALGSLGPLGSESLRVARKLVGM